MYTKEELDEMIYNWKTKRPPSRIGGPWVSTKDDDPMYGIIVFVLLMSVVGPLLILFRKFILTRDEREIQQDGEESEIIFPDPYQSSSLMTSTDPKLLPDDIDSD